MKPMRPAWRARAAAFGLAVAAAGCASTGAVPRPFPGADPPRRVEAPAGPEGAAPLGADGYALVGTALDLRGVPYRNGGADPDGFDCSGFTQYVFSRHGVGLPRSVKDQFETGARVDPGEIREGDLLFFAIDGPDPSHVGIAVGGDGFVHAPSRRGVVRVERLDSRYWARRFAGARRVL